MMYIGFSTQTHKLHACILCKKLKHCAPIITDGDRYYLYQFVSPKKIVVLQLKKRDLNILQKHSWFFIKYEHKPDINCLKKQTFLTCVEFTKHVCKIKHRNIITPYDLFKYLIQK